MQERINAILTGKAREVMNVKDIMESCLHESWIEMTVREKEAFVMVDGGVTQDEWRFSYASKGG